MRGEYTAHHVNEPAEARRAVERAVTEHCRAHGTRCDRTAFHDALLVASELTTNAILHGGGVTDFRVDLVDLVEPGLRLSVSDRSERLPVLTEPGERRDHRRFGGHGWPIVCRLARDVEVSVLPAGGKRISAVVPLTDA
ncbi:ATP-binding protein [Streptomyces sp. NPDC000983]|uniref:ATP-binding protein n=1 Tax=Streptomyces sp. NPDC000983 TaxID=3154373 RepID=UPI00332DB021